MALHLTPEIMEQAYELLRRTRPFKAWKLPHADEVEFRVLASLTDSGHHFMKNGVHQIAVNKSHTLLMSVMPTLAHEMCHMRQVELGEKSDHGPVFKRLADQVCRHHGFDRGTF